MIEYLQIFGGICLGFITYWVGYRAGYKAAKTELTFLPDGMRDILKPKGK